MVKPHISWKLLFASLLFALVTWSPRAAYASPLAQEEQTSGTVRLMVKFDPAAQSQNELSVLSTFPNTDDSLAKVGWQIIEVDATNAGDTIEQLQTVPGVVEVTPDYPLELTWNPNDPSYVEGYQWSLDKIGVDVAWEFSSGEAITVAVIDSGIDHNHPDLIGRIVPGYNFVDKNTDTSDPCGHGTHVAGIIAAQTGNGTGVAGIAHQAAIMPIKVIGATCHGSYSRLMQGIYYAVDQGVRIISITSGGGYNHTGLHDAIKYARSKGVLVAVSAGNTGTALPFYPGSYEESFTVAGTNQSDGQYANSTYGEQIDISAPAVSILSTYWDKDQGSTYAYLSGTSMAAPHVAAVAALVLAIDPKLSLEDLEHSLINSAADLGDAGWDPHFGWGRLTAWRAVAAVSPAAGNVRLGHFRVPNMGSFDLSNVTITAGTGSIELSWELKSFDDDHTVVIYRSPVPVFEAATDIAEVAAAATGSYIDSDVETGQEYYYWLVQADNDVEVAITQAYTIKLAANPLAPEVPETPQQPETPQEPAQPGRVALFMPLLER